MSRHPSRIPRPVKVRSRTLLAAQEVVEEQQPVPASQRTPEQISTAQVDDPVPASQITPEFEKWTKYEGREFTPPSEEIDPYSIFCPEFSPPGSPVFRVQAVRPPEEWSPPPHDIDPDQLFGTFTAPDAGVSLMGEPAQRFPSRSPTRTSSPPPCPPPEESLNLASWKRLPAQRFPSRSPTRISSPPPCPPSEESSNLANWRHLPDRRTDPVAFFRQNVPMSPSFGQGSPGPVPSPHRHETSALDPELLRMIFHIPRPDRTRGICPPSPGTYDLSRLFYETSPCIPTTSSAPCLPYADATLYHTSRRPWVGSTDSSRSIHRSRRYVHSAGTDSSRSTAVQGSPDLWWDPAGTSFSHSIPRRYLRTPAPQRVLPVSTHPQETPGLEWDPAGTSLLHTIPRGHKWTPASQSMYPASPWAQGISGFEWDSMGTSFLQCIPSSHMGSPRSRSSPQTPLQAVSPYPQETTGYRTSHGRSQSAPAARSTPVSDADESYGLRTLFDETNYAWPAEESPATAFLAKVFGSRSPSPLSWPAEESPATAFLAQVFGSRSPSPLSDTSARLPHVHSTPVCLPDELPSDFMAPTVTGGSRPCGARRRLWSPEEASSRLPSPTSLLVCSPCSEETSWNRWPAEESPATAAAAFLAQVFGSRSPSPLSDMSARLPHVHSTPVCSPDELPSDFWSPEEANSRLPSPTSLLVCSPCSEETSWNRWPAEESPATAASAFLAQVFGSRSPSPLSDTSARLPHVHSTPVCSPDELPSDFMSLEARAGTVISPESGIGSDVESTQHSHVLDFMTDAMPTDKDESLWRAIDHFKDVPDVLQHIFQLPEPQPWDEESEETEHDISCNIDEMDFCQLNMKVKEYWKIIREAEERTASLNADIKNMKRLNVALLYKVKEIRTGIIKAWEKFPETLYCKSSKTARRREELWKEFETMKRECEYIKTSNEEKSKYLKDLTNAICKLNRDREHFGDKQLSQEEKEEIKKSMERDSQEVGELAQLLTEQDQLLANALQQCETEKQRRLEYEEFLWKARKAKSGVLDKLDDVKDIIEIQKGMRRMLEQKLAAFDMSECSPQSKNQLSPSNLPAERA